MKLKTHIVFLLFILIFVGTAVANPVKQKFEEATKAYSQGRFQDAVNLYEEVIQLYPKLPQAYFFMGMAHRSLGTSLSEITWLFEKAIELDPEYAKAHENLGKIYYELGRFDEAEEQCLKTLQIEPQNISATLSLGWVYLLGQSDPARAIPYFEEAIRVHKPPYAYFGLGMAYFMLNERGKVLEMITWLRQNDQEQLAEQLENMIRDHIASPPQPGIPIFNQDRPGSSLVQPEKSAPVPILTGNSSVETIPVRLSGKLPNGDFGSDEQPVSPEERIQALKRKTQRYSRDSDY